MKKRVYQFIFFKLMGWKIVGDYQSYMIDIKKSVMPVVPHTSWHDFYIGLLTRGSLGININFVAKKELFKFPFGYYFKWVGGEPLNRFKNENKVDAIAKIFSQKEEFRLSISPEGTRKKVSEWKTGFYYIAIKANVPIVAIGFDWKNKQVIAFPKMIPSGDREKDFAILESYFNGIVGKVPEYSFTK
ncbi:MULTISPECIES: 1-acyl-sn-glycerol-3-phosphate acyltransferase [Flavobacterium]|nr:MULTISPECIES: 1-acyl-sn-glycerol-3-phosphate acyltransferase [Flavobacterium]OXA75837.1 acyltransferase [Flavobacterium columnare] [Flavobacterium columnare NBRC 100251 = ATCC 23463]AMA48719.1 acyltransferase [Flavobacterium covae]AND65145.1 acyltransferase [Flavobacterium covae]MCH4830673.1 1-acyl-sn-glycerol-3-phosphate acyltransferase [Flavobacterium columnare]MCH4833390.1 1-acyl-sn-glycerol-3-phosphate acyltransferase [Flavobacterium columnare]